MVPAAPPPTAPSGGGIDLSAGLTPATPATAPSGGHVPQASGTAQLHPVRDAIEDFGSGVAHVTDAMALGPYSLASKGNYTKGFVKQGERTVGGLLNLLASPPGAAADNEAMQKAGITPGRDVIGEHLKKAADWMNSNTDEDGFWQHVGGFGENLAELLTPESLAKLSEGDKVAKGVEAVKAAPAAAETAVSSAEKYANAANVAKLLDKYPKIKALVGVGLAAAAKVGGETGLQTYVKTGGDTQAALESGAVGAVTGGIATPIGETIADAIARRAATREMVGGVSTVIPAEVRNVQQTPQQIAGQASIKNAAQDTLGQRLQEVNESRAGEQIDESRALPSRTGPYEFKLQGPPTTETPTGEISQPAASRKPNALKPPAQYLTSSEPIPTKPGNVGSTGADISTSTPRPPASETIAGGGELRTQDPNVARMHVGRLNEIIDSPEFENMPPQQQSVIQAARSDAQRQIAEYHQNVRENTLGQGRPNLPQINIPETIKKVGSYTEAADHLENTATGGYKSISDALALNDISGGKFNTIRNANKEAWSAYKGATTADALRTSEQAIDDTNRQMTDLLKNDIGGAVTPKELDGFNDAYGQAQKLRYVANAVDRSFTGNPSSAARSWEYRGFNGTQLMGNLNRLETKFGRASLERVVGRENLNTLYQVAELNRTNASRAKFGAAVKPVAQYLAMHAGPAAVGGYLGRDTPVGWEGGAAAGLALSYGNTRVMNAVLTNPEVANNLIFAIRSGARPENYGPFIGSLITQAEQENAKPESEENPE